MPADLKVGDDVAKVKAGLERYQEMFLRGAAETVQIGGKAWHRLRLGPGAPVITWGSKGKSLVVGVGEGMVEEILKRSSGNKPQWLAAIRKQAGLPRVATVSYVNVKGILDRVAPLVGEARVRSVVDALGFANVPYVAAVTGLDDSGFASSILVGVDGEATGLLSLASAKPLVAGDLAAVPRRNHRGGKTRRYGSGV